VAVVSFGVRGAASDAAGVIAVGDVAHPAARIVRIRMGNRNFDIV
jgi:hypothetical protein